MLDQFGLTPDYFLQLRFANDTFTPYYVFLYPLAYFLFADWMGVIKAMTFATVLSIILHRFVFGRRQPVPNDSAIVLTGCSTGIGYDAALKCANLGFTVFATVRKSEHFDKLVANAPTAAKKRLVKIILDTRDAKNIQEAADAIGSECIARKLQLQSVIHNAGYAECVPLELSTEKNMLDQYQTNVFGPIHLTNALLPLLRASKPKIKPSVVFVASVVAHISPAGLGLYSSSKSALWSIASTYRQELATFGINVVCIEPGSVKTEFLNTVAATSTSNLNLEQGKKSILGEASAVYQTGTGEIIKTGRDAKLLAATPAFVTNAFVDLLLSNSPPTTYRIGYDANLLLPIVNSMYWFVELIGKITFRTKS